MGPVSIRGRLRPAAGWSGLILAAAAGVVLSSVPARGDNIDEQLVKEAPRILDYLREHKLSSVGVLRFRVKKGNEARTFAAGPMNSNMVTRLENVLALACDDGKGALQLIADPGETIAAQHSKLTYLEARGRAALFKLDYRAIGRSEPVKPDAFLFGTVVLGEDYATTTVDICVFTPAQLRPQTICQFTVPTDRDILSDVGQNFIITKRNWQRGQDRNQAALRSFDPNEGVPDEPEKKGGGESKKSDIIKKGGSGSPPDLKDFIEFKVLYDREEQSIELSKNNQWRIAPPRNGQSVEMVIKNVSDRQVGVVLMVNGLNTIMSKDGPLSSEQPKYVLDPKEEYRIKGFLQKDQRLAPFSVVSAEELGDECMSCANVGMIQLAVYDQEPEKEIKISTRRVTTPEMRKKPLSLRDVQQRSGLMRSSEGLIQPNPAATEEVHWKLVDFPHASQVGLRSIVYLGVKPQKEVTEAP